MNVKGKEKMLSTAVGGLRKLKRFEKRHGRATRVTAVSLALMMMFSIFSANVTSIVNLLDAYAKAVKVGSNYYYPATVELYDYYTDNEIRSGGDDNNQNNGVNVNEIFNTALYESGYVANAGTSSTLSELAYYPLYLGLQYPNQGTGRGNQMIHNPAAYKYSIAVNSQANSGTSAAVLGLVDTELAGGDITQGNGKVVLPYFDREFLEAPLASVLNPASVPINPSKNSVGRYCGKYSFNFLKKGSYYEYDSASDGLSSGFYAGSGTQESDLNGGKGFFPLTTLEGKKNFGYGAKFTVPFSMSGDGRMVTYNSDGTVSTGGDPIKFEFSGDDDVWVFIDGRLILDVGGAHGRVNGSINFVNDGTNKPYAKTDVVKVGTNSSYYGKGTYNASNGNVGTDGARQTETNELLGIFNSLGLYSDSSKEHTLTVFYIERGSIESNCKIKFNFQISDMLTVSNNIDTSTVNPTLVAQTEAVAEQEAVEYVMASDSATSAVNSPDRTNTTITPSNSSKVTVNFNTGGHGSVASKTDILKGTSFVLPRGYALSNPGYYLEGWSYGGSTYTGKYTVPPDFAGDTLTFTALWKKQPLSPLEDPPAPVLFFMNSVDKYHMTNYPGKGDDSIPMIVTKGADYNNKGSTWNENGTDATLSVFVNLTKEIKPAGYYAWMKIREHRTGGYEERQHPNGNATNNTSLARSGDSYVVYPTDTGYYVWNVYGSSNSSTLNVYDAAALDSNDSIPYPNESAKKWIKDYYKFYTKLKAFAEANRNTEDHTKRQKYAAAVQKYLNMSFSDSPSDAMTEFAASYAYSAETQTFYIYTQGGASPSPRPAAKPAPSPSPAPTPSVRSDNAGYTSLEGSTQSYEVTEIATPSGASLAPGEVDGGTYFEVTVPKYVVRTIEGESPENLANKLKITAGETEKTLNAEDMALATISGIADQPCFYFATGIKKHICDDTSYTLSDYKVVWFYKAGGAPAITYKYGSAEEYSVEVSLTTDAVTGYYYAKIPTYWQKYTGGSLADASDISVYFDGNLTGCSYATLEAQSVPCIFSGYDSYNPQELYTIVLERPNYTDGSGKLCGWTSWPQTYIYIQEGAAHPLACGAWPTTNLLMQPTAVKFEGNDVVRYDYFYMPALSGKNVVFKIHTGVGAEGNDEYWRSRDGYQPTIGGDTFFDYGGQDANNSTGHGRVYFNASSTLPDEVSDYTASAKSAAAMTRGRRLAPKTGETPEETPQDTAPEAPEGGESGSSGSNGQFVGTGNGTGTNYTEVGGTGFKLYDPIFKEVTGGDKEFAVRCTDEDGRYNLMFGQSARFTYQFNRGSHIKIAQTGSSYKFTSAQRQTGETANTASSTPIFSTTSSAYSGADPLPPALYQRYSTTFTVTDEAGTGSYNGAGPNAVKGTYRPTVLESGEPTFDLTQQLDPYVMINNIDGTSPTNDGIHVMVNFTNKVRTGDIIIKKTLTQQAFNECKAKYEAAASVDTEFYFRLKLKNVFGGGSAEEEYTGTYDHVVLTQVNAYDYEYQVKSGTSPQQVETVDIGGTSRDNIIRIKFSEMYTKSGGAYTYNNYAVRITGIPVFTEYLVEEISPDSAGFRLKNLTVIDDTTFGESLIDSSTGSPIYHKVTGVPVYIRPWEPETEGLHYPNSSSAPIKDQYTDKEVNMESGVLAYGYRMVGATAFNEVTAENDVEGIYLIITKKIDHQYYYTKSGVNTSDNPAGLLDRGGTVGGAASSADDYNGYQAATNAKQAFLFRIEEYAAGSDGNATGTAKSVIEEYISFEPGVTQKSVIIQVNVGSVYKVSEETGWSWKYDLQTPAFRPSGTNNSLSGNVVQIGNFTEKYIYSRTDPNRERKLSASDGDVTLNRTAEVAFTNNKATDDRRNVEGDTTVADNECPVPMHPLVGGGSFIGGP